MVADNQDMLDSFKNSHIIPGYDGGTVDRGEEPLGIYKTEVEPHSSMKEVKYTMNQIHLTDLVR